MKMKVSFIATVYNEEKTIFALLESLVEQSKLPDEIIIVDGGSADNTLSVISNFQFPISNKKTKFRILIKKGNRSVGRNEAVKHANGDIIASSDAGCILDKNWVKNIVEPFNDSKTDVVAGYYKGKAKNIFEKCLIPYVLVMPDKINSQDFLPASRSMAFRKSIWKKIGGFSEEYSHNEDYVFAQKLKKIRAKIVFEKNAIVNWIPRKNLKKTFIMFLRFAIGDAESRIYRPKVILIFARYLIISYLLFLTLVYNSFFLSILISFSFLGYIAWSIVKNYRFVNHIQGFFYLPLLQLTSDTAILAGTFFGLIKGIRSLSLFEIIRKHKGLICVIGIYAIVLLAVLDWGIPNFSHPFTYHMDEWHQAQAVRTVFTQGSPNVEGSANGSMFHFLLSGLWLVPFIITGIVNPFAIASSVESLEIQHRLFQILRLNTLFFGVLSIIVMAYIGKKYFKLNPFFVSFLFVVNPIWLSLSNYFKYDIALTFWIILSLKFLLDYGESQDSKKYYYAGVVCALALSTKISALPIIVIYIFAYVLYTKNFSKKIKNLFIGTLIFFITFLIFGIPDLIFGKGNMLEYLYSNLVATPKETSNLNLGMNYLTFLFLRNYPSSFGHIFFIGFISIFFISVLKYLINFFKSLYNKSFFTYKNFYENFNNLPLYKKNIIFIYGCFSLFLISLVPLRYDARGNKLLVLLPFMVIIFGVFFRHLRSANTGLKKIFFILFIFLIIFFQAFEVFAWLSVKLMPDPRYISSVWVQKNIKKNSVIGIENIPIYQSLPNFILKEYYDKKYNNSTNTKYRYEIISYKTSKLPNIVILTNDEVTSKYLKNSAKKFLLTRLSRDGYKKVVEIQPDFFYFKFVGNELDFFYSQLPASPNSISFFIKDEQKNNL